MRSSSRFIHKKLSRRFISLLNVIFFTLVSSQLMAQTKDTIDQGGGLPFGISPIVILIALAILIIAAVLWRKKIIANSIFTLLVLAFVGVILLFVTFEVRGLGNFQGYEPDQPIAYSHKLHAGKLKISCLYCHFGAEKSKHAGIPPVNVCMNCHVKIKQRDSESLGIYQDVIQDVNLKKQIAKESKSKDFDIEEFMEKMKDKSKSKAIVKAVEERVKKSATEIQKIYKAIYDKKSIEWIKVHNLPDFVYFNHSQHVMVGGERILGRPIQSDEDLKKTCFKCHGPIDTMEKVRQYSSLTMGWCLDCHKSIKTPGKKNAKPDETVAHFGGKNCSRCHY
ncbi:MAG: hypothetical protein IEMM0008_0261 [bacterium]|nr:MAG: hypothetical protein IEMM0008_0261 [bacterium]